MNSKRIAESGRGSKAAALNPTLRSHDRSVELFSTQRLPQELDLTISILFEQRPSVSIEMATREHLQLLWLASFPIGLQSDIGRAKHVVVRHDHEQWGG
jgi:hypothetical protein